MGLDTPPPQDLLHAVAEAGRENSTATVLFHTAVAERAGLGPSDHKALDVLLREGPHTAGDLADRIGLSPASVSALVDRLEARGYVRRTRDANDRRRVLVAPAPEGLAPLAALFEPFQAGLTDALADFSDDQLATVLDFLARTNDLLRQNAERLRGG